jgi:Zn-dependent M28 family amino/carboxypeptidase
MTKQYSSYFMHSRLGFKNDEDSGNNGSFIVGPSAAATILNSTKEKMTKAFDSNNLSKIKGGSIEYIVSRKVKAVGTENVLGFLEGTDKKDEIVIITAHYDHIGKRGEAINNGADDDGSGTTAVLKIAKAFVKAKNEGHGPKRSMLFMTVTGEEKGLLGSEYYTNHPVFPLENTVVDLNIDMVGRSDEKHADDREFVYLVGSDKLSTELHDLSEKANDTFTNLSLDYTYNDPDHPDRFYYRSDHWNFAKNNIPIIFYFNGVHEDYHRPTDTVDKIEFDMLQKRAQLVYYTAWVIANREDRLVVDKLKDVDIEQKK